MGEYKLVNPYDGKLLATYPFAAWNECDAALEKLSRGRAAQNAMSPHRRAEILGKLAAALEKDAENLAKLVTAEIGKTIADSRIELARAASTLVCSAEEARRRGGEVLDSDSYGPKGAKRGIVEWKPLGVVLAITPFNFPINIAVHKLGPAFAAGNTTFLKPAPQGYLSSKRLVELAREAGMTEDVLQFLVPDIPEMARLVEDPRVHCVNFTGGLVAAREIAKRSGFKKLLFELGGNDPLIVMGDADLDLAVKSAIAHRFATAGQRCTASKRVFVHESVYGAFKEKLLAETRKLKTGDPAKDETFVGPVVSAQAADVVMARVAAAIKEGAKLLHGNTREGNVIAPTILEGVKDTSVLVKDETFGPVIPLRSFKELDELVKLVNATEFGLQSGVFTHDLRTVKLLYDKLEVGALAVNDGPGFRAEHFPFGGVKESGVGREGVKYAMQEMSYRKTLVL